MKAAPSLKVHRQHARRLGRVHDQGHSFPLAKCRDLIDGQDEAEDVGDHGTHNKLRLFDPFLEDAQAGSTVEKRRGGDDDLRTQGFQRPRDGVVLIAGDEHLCPRLCKRMDGDVEAVGRVHGEDDVVRIRHAEKLRRLFPAAIDELGCPHRGGVTAAAGACAGAHGVDHGAGNRGRFYECGGRVIEIDHSPTPPGNCRHRRAHRPCRSEGLRFS